eukprot:gene7976-10048_t
MSRLRVSTTINQNILESMFLADDLYQTYQNYPKHRRICWVFGNVAIRIALQQSTVRGELTFSLQQSIHAPNRRNYIKVKSMQK